jgi:hypothetical protein
MDFNDQVSKHELETAPREGTRSGAADSLERRLKVVGRRHLEVPQRYGWREAPPAATSETDETEVVARQQVADSAQVAPVSVR